VILENIFSNGFNSALATLVDKEYIFCNNGNLLPNGKRIYETLKE
jgi:hypothetical protein